MFGKNEIAFFHLPVLLNQPIQTQNTIFCDPNNGPCFGLYDLKFVLKQSHQIKSSSNLGHTFVHPKHNCNTHEAASFLGGSQYFFIDEIEVFNVV
jgi:hypothetical protein